MLSKRMQQLKPSPTLALAAKAKELKSQGKDVISLTVGEPDWPTYGAAKEAGIQAIHENKTTYTPAAGIPELRKAVAQLIGKQLAMEVSPQQVTIGSGAKFIIYTAFTALLDPGDEVIVPSPYWVSYPTMVELAGGTPKIVECDAQTHFKLSGPLLKSAITEKTKILLLNSPSNPTGAEYSHAELDALAEVLKEYPNLWIVSDDIYNQLSFHPGGLSPHLLHKNPELKERCISINGMSKAYAMTGWRMGWAVGPEAVIKAMASFQSQTTGAPCSISQWASLAAITETADEVKESLVALQERRELFIKLLNGVPGLQVFPPQGAFYLWVKVQDWLGKTYKGKTLVDSKQLSQILLEDVLLAVVPGAEFGTEGYLRLSFAASPEDLKRASERLANFQQQLS
ncbi:MAG: pyridoxal phosphate-dependent aminotransferase [Bdellovibrionales bacterium]|nr:pyridoxal phosphate-dependent aminotransferase [Bdellovibrionales bacterium]